MLLVEAKENLRKNSTQEIKYYPAFHSASAFFFSLSADSQVQRMKHIATKCFLASHIIPSGTEKRLQNLLS